MPPLNDSAATAPAGSQPDEKAAATEARPAPKGIFAATRLASRELLLCFVCAELHRALQHKDVVASLLLSSMNAHVGRRMSCTIDRSLSHLIGCWEWIKRPALSASRCCWCWRCE